MCGIVGYTGSRPAAPILLTGLKRLEYRGYDSAGLALHANGGFEIRRAVGPVRNLESLIERFPVYGTSGIAHTRWATHGSPVEANTHPHTDATGKITLAHNGIIENHSALRSLLESQGIKFSSETDTETLVQLIGLLYSRAGNFMDAIREALDQVRGTWGLAIMCADLPGHIVAARRGSPLLVGIGDGEHLVASDGQAIVEHTSQVVHLKDNEMALLHPDGMELFTHNAARIEPFIDTLETQLAELELNAHEHFMHKEIWEQPSAITQCLAGRLNPADGNVILGGLAGVERELSLAKRLVLLGCGSAWHACLVGKHLIEELAGLPCNVEYASEFRYRNPIVESGSVAIAVSQSGETADTLAALREARLRGALTLGIVNSVGSTLSRETDAGIFLHVGAEIGVASTKAFTAQIAVLAMLALSLGRRRHLSPERTLEIVQELHAIPGKITSSFQCEPQVRELALRLSTHENWLFLGRGVNYPVALEGALKLKETSYIHAEGLPAAEMKHGPIALIDAGMPVVVVAPRDHTYEKVLGNVQEVKSRGGHVLAIASEQDEELFNLADDVIVVPQTHPLLSPILTTIPLQLIAYHAALARGQNVDRPRNLAKSVTVE